MLDLQKLNQFCDSEAEQVKDWMSDSQEVLSDSDLAYFSERVVDNLGYVKDNVEYYSVLELVKEKLHCRLSVQL